VLLDGCVIKVLVVGELLSWYTGVHGDVAFDEFNQCPVRSNSQRYLDSLYRCHPGEMSSTDLLYCMMVPNLFLPRAKGVDYYTTPTRALSLDPLHGDLRPTDRMLSPNHGDRSTPMPRAPFSSCVRTQNVIPPFQDCLSQKMHSE